MALLGGALIGLIITRVDPAAQVCVTDGILPAALLASRLDLTEKG